jgi:acetolactate synthase small subunit
MVENSPGVLTKVTSLFSEEGYNIISLIASENRRSFKFPD